MTTPECCPNRAVWFVAALAFTAGLAPARAQCASAPIATLVPDDPMVGDYVGISALAISASGDRVVFGSAAHSHAGSQRGAAWVVSNPTTASAQIVELMPAAVFDGAGFAASLAMNAAGDVITAGAPAGFPSWPDAMVYVFRFNGTTWTEAWSASSPSGYDDDFGRAVATDASGDLIAVGAPGRLNGPNLDIVGAIEIYRRQSSAWVLEKTLLLPMEAGYGGTLALSDDGSLLAVRSKRNQVNGSVNLHRRDGGAWNLVANLHEAVAHSVSGSFAPAIDIDATGQTVVIGSPLDWRKGYSSGAVFVFRNGPAGWSLELELLLPNQGIGFQLGYSVAINAAGDRIVAGAPGYVSNGQMVGAVYPYARANGAWQLNGVSIAPIPDKFGSFGHRVAASATGRQWAASEPDSDWNVTEGGAVHVFKSPCTQPGVYCTAQTNSLGCVPHLVWDGLPSAFQLDGFKITLFNTRNQRSGVLFYGTTSPIAQPWNGGTLCVQPPLRRTPLQFSGGSPPPAEDCSGAFGFDFNAWYPNDPALFAGAHVFAQYLSRDPSPTSQVNLSDALDFYLEP